MSFVKLNLEIDENNVQQGALEVLKTVRPSWKQENINFKVFTDGITNKLVGCFENGNRQDMVLVRVYGQKTDLIIDRNAEIRNMQILHAAGCAPELYCGFNNGLCYQFVTGDIVGVERVTDPKISRLIAKEMAKMHAIKDQSSGNNVKSTQEPSLFPKIKRWLEHIPDKFDDSKKDERYQEHIPRKSELLSELAVLQQHLETLGSPIVFCHNDILVANIIFNQETEKITFIDYEYASYNYQGFDIGDHFCEFAGVDEVDYSRYPSKDFQLTWLRNYLQAEKELRGVPPTDVLDRDVERLYVQANKFALAAHFFWGIWAIIQARYSTIDFDFLGYGILRFREYFKRKEEFFNLKMPSD